VSAETDDSLDALIRRLEAAAPAARIQYRERVLAHGVSCVEPLTGLALRSSEFTASVAAWLEALARREPSTALGVQIGLRQLVSGGPDGRYARDALQRLGEDADSPSSVKRTGTPTAPSANYLEVRAQVHQAAREGRILHYSDLATNRSLYGRWLGIISEEEMAAGHPPISAIVVAKGSERPGPGFYQLCRERDFAQPGESDEEIWQRAVVAVHDFWREQPAR
jgi:hypothetical protein